MFKKMALASSAYLMLLVTVTSAFAQTAAVPPQLPRIFLNTDTMPPVTGRSILVPAGGDFQAAIDAAQYGDEIVLQAGASYVGHFRFTSNGKPNPNGNWITIRTSNLSQLPPIGTRVSPANAVNMPKLIAEDNQPVIDLYPTHDLYLRASNLRFVGIEVINNPNWDNYGLIKGGASSWQTQKSQSPTNIYFDRMYIHGDSVRNVFRGIILNGGWEAVTDSYISGIAVVGEDAQAIAGWNGIGPFKIVNNYIEGAGENVLFGGADPNIVNLVPSDIEFRFNDVTKPTSWYLNSPDYAGRHWTVKNLFELKNARRVLIEGNRFTNCWVDGQVGHAILFTPRNQNGTAPWSTVEDVTFRNNYIADSASGFQLLGFDNINTSQQMKRVDIYNNLLERIGDPFWGGSYGAFIVTSDNVNSLFVRRNESHQRGSFIIADIGPASDVVITENYVDHGAFGVFGANVGEGNAAFHAFFPTLDYRRNAMVNGNPSLYTDYPDNEYPTRFAVKLVGLDGASIIGLNREEYLPAQERVR